MRRRGSGAEASDPVADGNRVLVVGLGNPGPRYTGSRHNIGYEVTSELARRWDLPQPKEKFKARISEGRAGIGGPRVTLLQPLTFMNESGRSVGPARGSLKLDLDRIVVVHDEIDLKLGEVRSRLGGGLAGHNGLKSLAANLGGPGFWRVRVGVGRPDTTDPELVAAYVLGRFEEPRAEVEEVVARAADEADELVRRVAEGSAEAQA